MTAISNKGEQIPNCDKSAYPAITELFFEPGLTKREAFAMAAMQGILASRELQECLITDQKIDGTNHENCFAAFAVKQADALLNELDNSYREYKKDF